MYAPLSSLVANADVAVDAFGVVAQRLALVCVLVEKAAATFVSGLDDGQTVSARNEVAAGDDRDAQKQQTAT